jgi:hypothetical protein
MRTRTLCLAFTAAAVTVALLPPGVGHAQPAATAARPAELAIPESVRHEHEEIHATLVDGTKAPGRVGAAARALAEVLHPHFVREEEIALPPLGLLAPLAAGTPVPEAVSTRALTMTATLRREMPRMLEEHTRIRAAVEALRAAADAEGAARYQQLAEHLAVHAQTEEEVLYPAAQVVGDLLRRRPGQLR